MSRPPRPDVRSPSSEPAKPASPSAAKPAAPLPARKAYRLWADGYDEETVVSTLDDLAVRRLTPPLSGLALLDAACGTGRRLAPLRSDDRSDGADEPARAVGIDLVHAMLSAGRRARPDGSPLAAGDLRALPIADGRFDVIWCRLALGHLPTLDEAYRELARVCRHGGRVIVTGFHPEAALAGHSRTFRDPRGRLHAVEHFVHRADDHERAARLAGLTRVDRIDATVGPTVRAFYERAGALERYRSQRGLPLVLAMGFVSCHTTDHGVGAQELRRSAATTSGGRQGSGEPRNRDGKPQ